MALIAAFGAALTALTACTQFPALNHTVTADMAAAQYPDLVPLSSVLKTANTPSIAPLQTNARIASRIRSLKQRAARLRGSVLTNRETQRFAQGLH